MTDSSDASIETNSENYRESRAVTMNQKPFKIGIASWSKMIEATHVPKETTNRFITEQLSSMALHDVIEVLRGESNVKVCDKLSLALRISATIKKLLLEKKYDEAFDYALKKFPEKKIFAKALYNIKLIKLLDSIKAKRPMEALYIAQKEISTIEGFSENNDLIKELATICVLPMTKGGKNFDKETKKFVSDDFKENVLHKIHQDIWLYLGSPDQDTALDRIKKHLAHTQAKISSQVSFPEFDFNAVSRKNDVVNVD